MLGGRLIFIQGANRWNCELIAPVAVRKRLDAGETIQSGQLGMRDDGRKKGREKEREWEGDWDSL